MATKPTQQPEIWASAVLYASGPKTGQPTKATSEAGAAVEGHKPGPTEPTTCNEFNVFENKMSLLARWTFAGRFDKMADAHPVETDVNGLLSSRAADFGDPTQPGPSLNVISSGSDWAAKVTASDAPGLRVQGIHTPEDASQLALITTNQDNAALLAALRVVCTDPNSASGIRIEASTSGTIDGENLMAALDVANNGGTGVQVRTLGSILPAMRALNREDGGTSARFGYGSLETGSPKNLDGTAIACMGGDADVSSLAARAGSGVLTQGGASVDSEIGKPAGHGLLALSGPTAVLQPGGAAVWAQTVGPRGIAVEASHNSASATLPVVQATTGDNVASAFKADVTGTGNGLEIVAEASPGVQIQMNAAGGGGLAAAVRAEAQGALTTAPFPGDIWCEQQLGSLDLRTGIKAEAQGYVRVSKQATCYARSAEFNPFNMVGTGNVDTPIGGEFTWSAGREPSVATKVKITISGTVSQHVDSITTATFKVRDKTVGGDPTIASTQGATPDFSTGAGGNMVYSITKSVLYDVPAGGARDFDLVWDGTVGSASGAFRGFVTIEEITGD